MGQLYPTTELEAVNTIISTIGEAPVSTLENNSLEDVTAAKNILDETVVDVQSTGWNFNREYNFKINPDTDGNVNIPANAVYADSSNRGNTADKDVVIRGTKLYDRENQTFTFTDAQYVDLILILPWDDLPQPARRLITIKAARRFQNRVFGSDSLNGFTQIDETEALVQLEQSDSRSEDANMLTGNWGVYRVLRRTGSRKYNI
ncbi:MAG: phage tail protein [Gammaproteobacteria bacterium]|nr:phage tail protein [Gammaproteobacteria bacterium]|tara:strand:- start:9471 stop:10082 length:612 start_codon:yes stop_codon:yes gene_type:complete